MPITQQPRQSALRGRLLWYEDDPVTTPNAVRYLADGVVVLVGGIITAVGEASALLPTLAHDTPITDHRPNFILPGFIDCHLHMPQTQVIASYGTQLLDWLNRYTFIEEQRYGDATHAAKGAAFLCDTLLAHGTTTAVAFCSVHKASVEAYFEAAIARNMRMIGGKVMMDCNCPEALQDTVQQGFDDSAALIARYHGKARLAYAIAPRFAITSSPAQLEAAGALHKAHPDCYIETHLSENHTEIATVAALYPNARDYTDVYDHYGLLSDKSLFGHCIYLSAREQARLSETQSVAVFCPTSNLFLGSGLFNWQKLASAPNPVRIALATDIGGGTSYSMLQTAAEAYKILQLQGQSLSPHMAFYQMTLGNARALQLDAYIGQLNAGYEADLVVLSPTATPAMAHRHDRAQTLEEELFILMMLGDSRVVAQTYVLGKPMLTGAATLSP